jgi:Ca-activated chloride channel family protein
MTPNDQKVGLRAKDGKAHVGLLSVHVTGRISGLVAQMKVRQVYKNWSESNIECVYTFPLAWQSVLLGMSVELNGKRLSGVVKPRKVAESEYDKAIDSGDLPVMLERAGKDLYTANIGNIQPGDEVVVEMDYAQILKVVDGAIRLSMPTTIAPRYGDAADAGLRLHQRMAPDAQAEQRLFISIELDETLSAGMVHSPTHTIHQTRQGDITTYKLHGMAWLDRDFVLVIDRIQDLNFALAAPDPMRPGESTVFTGSVYRPDQTPRPRPLNLKILVDCSGSMQGDSIVQAGDGLHWLLGQLNSADMVSLTRFGSHVVHEHKQLQHCNLIHKQVLKAGARRLKADLGGTEIDQALQSVIEIERFDGESISDAAILLITDGEVWDIEETIATVRASGHRIFALGVGSSPAESLLQDMAEVTGGACEMVTPGENMQKAVERLLIRLRQSQAAEQTVHCQAPVLWSAPSARHATPGESVSTWSQLEATPSDLVVSTGKPTQKCLVHWCEDIELSRIAAALRLRDMTSAKDREALAMQYQLVSSETNLILVHERAEAEKAEDLPELHQVRPMLAAGWGGNGTVAYSRSQTPLPVMRTGSDNAPFMAESRTNMSQSVPSVWRSSRTHSAARFVGMANSGMDDIEIPAFLRKQTDSDPVPASTSSKRSSASSLPPERPSTTQLRSPQPSRHELELVLNEPMGPSHLVHALVNDFNQVALRHTQFRSALATCMRSNHGTYLEWLVTRHMTAAGSAAPVWALFIQWAADVYRLPLDRHAQRLLRDFLKAVSPELQASVLNDLEGLIQNSISNQACK